MVTIISFKRDSDENKTSPEPSAMGKPENSNIIKRLHTARKHKLTKVAVLERELSSKLNENQVVYETKLQETKNFSNFYRYLRAVRRPSQVPPIVRWKNIEATSSTNKAELFNSFFQSTFSQKDMSSFTLSGSKCERVATEFDVSESNIRKILRNLDINKAKGPDGLPPLLFKQTKSTIAKSISDLFTNCKRLGVFPTSWKVGRVSPIHKKGNKTAVENYRPVTILDIISKVFEKPLFDAIYQHVEPLLTNAQFGFRKKRSAVFQMLSVLNDIYTSMRVKNIDSVHALFLDFEKAFDKVNHHVFLAKLWKLEIRGKLFSVIQSYLSNRKQFFVVDGVCSSTLEVTSGVPQGSLLGPLLFIIFINDIPASVENGFTSLFPDDVEISYINSSATDIQLELENLHDWAVSNSMKFSSTKCNSITFKGVPLNIKIADFNISSITVKTTLALLSQKDFPGQNTSEKDALKQTGRFL